TILAMRPKTVKKAPCQQVVLTGEEADLDILPIQTCWPGEPAPLITWPLVITRPPEAAPDDAAACNIGVYRMQKLGPRRAIMRWLAHRGGAAHHRAWAARGEDMPVAVAIGADPATVMAAVTPVPETLGEYLYAGLLRRRRGELVPAVSQPLLVPASAEIVLEGTVSASETAPEGPYGDHTGYYNASEPFPVFRLTAITMRRDPLYLTTFTGRPPDEPSVIARALNEVFLPLLRQQFPEIVDFWLPPEGCSYRIGIARIRKRYPGQARRLMMGLWSFLPQFSYTKMLIVVDEDIDARDWADVMWALSTRFDAGRDVLIVPDTPVDYLDFASPVEGLGAKMGLDATTKIGVETEREWGRVLRMDAETERRVEELWRRLGLEEKG
ncbi:MAG TPA: UbiD family decarboxylase, partial [Thermopetrobacter sp.]|nr:UbiD family decarboxylase [Thermopetrobacter sp.]